MSLSVCMSAQTKDLESVCMIGTQCRCVGSRCHLEKTEWAGRGRGWGGVQPHEKRLWLDRKIKETIGV